MKPVPRKALDGRANPRGVAYLYLADSEITACSEVRPWVGSFVSLGLFAANRDLKIVHTTLEKRSLSKFKGLNWDFDGHLRPVPFQSNEYEAVIWGDIGHAMSTPVAPEDSALSYIPTQIIAESLRHHGADGIAYNSLLSKGGINIVLFDINAADLILSKLLKVNEIRVVFDQVDNSCDLSVSDSDDAANNADDVE